MNVIDEEWNWDTRGGQPGNGALLFSSDHEEEWATTWGVDNHARAQLAAQAPAMARLLLEVMPYMAPAHAEAARILLRTAGVFDVPR